MLSAARLLLPSPSLLILVAFSFLLFPPGLQFSLLPHLFNLLEFINSFFLNLEVSLDALLLTYYLAIPRFLLMELFLKFQELTLDLFFSISADLFDGSQPMFGSGNVILIQLWTALPTLCTLSTQ